MEDGPSKNKAIFQIPRYLSLLRSKFVFLAFLLVIIFLPFLIIEMLHFERNFIVGLILLVYIGMMWVLFSPFVPFLYGSKEMIGWLWVERLQNYPVRQWILKNVKCPKCGGQLISSKRLFKVASQFSHYFYICGSCGKKFEIEKYKKLKRTWILKEKESRRSKQIS